MHNNFRYSLVVILIFVVPLLQMAQWLWSRDHYQFFPLVLLGVGYLCYERIRAVEPAVEGVGLCVRTGFWGTLSLGLYALGSFANSHWLGTLAAMVFVWMLVWWLGGLEVAKCVRGPYLLLLLVVPLPLELDRTLVIQLQQTATESASGLLDWRNIRHVSQGVALTTSEGDFLVEEACSGIHSLFSCVTVMMFFAVYQRYGFIRSVLTLVHTVLWVVIANAIRVFLIVWSRHRFDVSLDEGTSHQLLGFGTYGMALGLALSMDQLLRFLVKHDPHMVNEGSPLRQWRRQVRDFFNRPLVSTGLGLRFAQGALAFGFVPLTVLSVWHVVDDRFLTASPPDNADFSQAIQSEAVEQRLPIRVNDFKRVDVRSVSRDAADPFGDNSVIATYQGGGMVVQFSVDGLYAGWHDLGICYAAMDWHLESGENLQRDAAMSIDAESAADWETQLDLYRNDGQRALCLFSCYDSTNRTVEPDAANSSPMRRLMDRLRSVSIVTPRRKSIQGMVYQHQLLYVGESELMPFEKERLRSLFHALSKAVSVDSPQERSASETGKKLSGTPGPVCSGFLLVDVEVLRTRPEGSKGRV